MASETAGGSSARRDLTRDFVSSHRPAGRRNAVRHASAGREAFARSARTRRSGRSSRGGPHTGGVYGIQYGIVCNWRVIEYRDDSVKHATSPTRRDCARQAVISSVFQIQSTASEHQNQFSPAPPRTSARISSTRSRSSLSALLVSLAGAYLSCSKQARMPA